MKRLLLLPLIALFAISFSYTSNADVFIEDVNGTALFDETGITSGPIDTGSGQAGNYELIACGIERDTPTVFSSPTPGNWFEINNSACTLPECQLGIWGRFSDSANSEQIACNWGANANGFVAGSFRFSNVDPINPIIDAACTELSDGLFTRRAVASEPGAQLVTYVLFRITPGGNSEPFVEVSLDEVQADFVAIVGLGDESSLFLTGNSDLDILGAGTQAFSQPAPPPNIAIKQCVVSLRMQPRVIPTMSEWGMIGFAAFAGIAGLFFLRRRQATA